ncbi:MAG: hypothetical protein JNL13_05425 [Chitinophagaceae bacterium]|nr:hypothetical protein [Chitinophagaceae bacterium]
MEQENQAPPNNKKTWLKRIGIAGFLFFLLKGIAWLFVFYFGFKFSGCR